MSISCIASHLDTPSYNTAQSDKVENATLITNYQPAAGSYFTKSVLNGKYAFQPDASGIVSSWASTTSVMMSSNTAQTPGSQTSSDKLILVKLPGGMHTYISTKPNQLLCDALERKLFQRDWRIEMCSVYRLENGVKHFVDWATDIFLLKHEEFLQIEFRDQYKQFGALKQTHDITTKRFLLGNCCVCRQTIVLEGFICKGCGLKCHKLCGEKLPDKCKASSDYDQNSSHQNSRSSADKVPSSDSRRKIPHPIVQDYSTNNELSPYNATGTGHHHHHLPPSSEDSGSPDSKHRTRSQSEPKVSMNAVNTNNHNYASSSSTSTTPPSDSQISVNQSHKANKTSSSSHHQYSSSSAGNTLSLPRRTREVRSAEPNQQKANKSPQGSRTRGSKGSSRGGSKGSNLNVVVNPTSGPINIVNSGGGGGGVTGSSGLSSQNNNFSTDNIHALSHSLGRDLRDHGRLGRRNNEIWAIPSSELETKERIGSGSFGTVYKGHYHGNVAIKKLNLTNPTKEQLSCFENEVLLLKKCRHANILLFYGFTTDAYLAIVTQWCEGKSLYWHIHVEDSENPERFLTNYEKLSIAKQTAQGMSYLHSKTIIHRDLKSNNIFLLDDYTVKIGDFGLATLKSKWNTTGSTQERQPTGSILWMAPEVLMFSSDTPYSYKSDVYSFGIVLFELFSGNLPYNGLCRDVIIYMVGKGFLKPDLSQCQDDTPADLKQLLIECVQKKPDDRPLFPEIHTQLQQLLDAQPKIQRSNSAPLLLTRTRTATNAEDSSFYDKTTLNTPSPRPQEIMNVFFGTNLENDGEV
ncbi:RAF proto-oncogene serine/threonine-protein kinase-like isoform X2 [Convolutriloba macropyga]|uniref:RAF proto-oncogene serine/threonine-protein kinase-like isoform X2 n=1 Tax=Convolutriloba macropyga TaxID=536237 RepID=UPI003F528956